MQILVKKRPRSRLSSSVVHSTKTGVLERIAADQTVLIDTREQIPWDLRPFASRVTTLATGDYTLEGQERAISIERKGEGLADLLACVGRERARFERELDRMAQYRYRWVICEGSWHDLCCGRYQSKIPPTSAIGSIVAWQVKFETPFIFTESRPAAEALVIRILANLVRSLAHTEKIEDGTLVASRKPVD